MDDWDRRGEDLGAGGGDAGDCCGGGGGAGGGYVDGGCVRGGGGGGEEEGEGVWLAHCVCFCLRARKVWWCAVVDGCGSSWDFLERAHAGAVGMGAVREVYAIAMVYV